MMISAHSEANRTAVARPIPLDPPVTTTVLFENLFDIWREDKDHDSTIYYSEIPWVEH